MRYVHSLLLLAAAAGVGAAGVGSFDGVWVVESITFNGKPLPREQIKGLEATIQGEKYTIRHNGKTVEEGITRADKSRQPVAFVSTVLSGEDKGKKVHGIMTGEGTTFKVHMSLEGNVAPKDFTPREGTVLVVYRKKTK